MKDFTYYLNMSLVSRFFISVLAICGVFAAVSCHKDNGPEKEKTYLDFLTEDYNSIVSAYPEAKDGLVEAQYILNASVNARQTAELYPREVTYLFYVPGGTSDGKDMFAKGYRDLVLGERGTLEASMEVLSSPWTADRYIRPEAIGDIISIEDAINSLKLANVQDTDTPYVTLRWPVNPELENPQYVFTGDKTKTVFVDAFTAEVKVAD
jgi:hypothetical protein